MSDEPKSFEPLDLNRAPFDALVRLPGIGPELAQRIIEARPFSAPDDLVRVSGIGPVLLERLRPYLTVSTAAPVVSDLQEVSATTDEPEEPGVENPVEVLTPATAPPGIAGGGEEASGEPSPEPEILPSSSQVSPLPAAQEAVSPVDATEAGSSTPPETPETSAAPEAVTSTPAPLSAEKLLTRREVITWVVVSNLVTLFLAVVLALLFLGLINGTLRYTSLAQFRQFRAEVTLLSERVDRLERNLETMTARVQALEGLSARVAGLESQTSELSNALEQAREDIQAVQTLVKGFDQRLSTVEAASARFERFLSGLRQLLLETSTGTEEAP
ncbi:helix-hairpin-helix domain-containing protein [Thermanaerothrix sp. 4228-RoL]|uniref:Helix-hairpin-helix domain-containing protein n=1 Tax=Thermanaerothrix solaris TaxID=3058434 RepID=A0ABU3NMC0_9CHLR|nr:helix-hairpin-helix domain-containing protein [Thermanaerothrix sp. 4228-RoL]MDT8897995.1 helix-hairpin-helix domain-containing protein [Thermanaerothrix sp. 4228-RoL]